MTTSTAKEAKPYILIFKKNRPSMCMTEARGEQLAKWWLAARPSEKTAIYDDFGNFQEIIQSSEVSWIGRKEVKPKTVDADGNKIINGYRCGWGTFHDMATLQDGCDCWGKFGMHFATMFHILREKWPNIHTCSDITEEMQNYILFVHPKQNERI